MEAFKACSAACFTMIGALSAARWETKGASTLILEADLIHSVLAIGADQWWCRAGSPLDRGTSDLIVTCVQNEIGVWACPTAIGPKGKFRAHKVGACKDDIPRVIRGFLSGFGIETARWEWATDFSANCPDAGRIQAIDFDNVNATLQRQLTDMPMG
jgi:hypothetical protein